MPPKPFKPPRPASSTSKAKPRAKSASTSTSAKKSTGTPNARANSNGVTKSKPKTALNGNGKNGKDKETRISAASRLSFAGLPSLSPDSDDEREAARGRGGDSDEEEEAEEEGSDSMVDEQEEEDMPTTKGRRTSKAAAKPRTRPPNSASPDASRQEAGADAEPQEAAIPLDLLNVLLHQFYKEDNTRMSKDANRAVGRYMETFVRETLARVAYAKEESGGAGGTQGASEVLEVEDLEKVAPQMLLDF